MTSGFELNGEMQQIMTGSNAEEVVVIQKECVNALAKK